MKTTHYGLKLGDKVRVLNHPLFKDEIFVIDYLYRLDNNKVIVKNENDSFAWTAECCKKVIPESEGK